MKTVLQPANCNLQPRPLRLRRGFTLIEILIVVAIIGILASVVLVGVGPIQRRGRDARRMADLRETQQAVELYSQKCNYYPGAAQSGSDCGNYTQISDWGDLTAALTGSGIGVKQIPKDPSGRDYFYGSDGFGYALGARLEDPTNPSLKSDIDGDVYGVDCDDPVYCIEF